jgi:hypothetical protein
MAGSLSSVIFVQAVLNGLPKTAKAAWPFDTQLLPVVKRLAYPPCGLTA